MKDESKEFSIYTEFSIKTDICETCKTCKTCKNKTVFRATIIACTVFALIVTMRNETNIHLFISGQNYIPLSIEVWKKIDLREKKSSEKLLSRSISI